MRVALIPPLGWEKYLGHSDIHLALALPNLVANPYYTQPFFNASMRGEHVIIDNGAAEGSCALPKDIKKAAVKVNAAEVVLPDVIGNRLETRAAIAAFVTRHIEPDLKYMAVLQGHSVPELMKLAEQLTRVDSVSVLGIPRHLLTSLDAASVRIEMANWIQDAFPNRFEIHLLGTNPAWVTEVKAAAKYAPHIRSVDTSMPFNYALANQSLEQCARIRKAIRRPAGYFDNHALPMNEGLVLRNIEFMKNMAKVTEKADVD